MDLRDLAEQCDHLEATRDKVHMLVRGRNAAIASLVAQGYTPEAVAVAANLPVDQVLVILMLFPRTSRRTVDGTQTKS